MICAPLSWQATVSLTKPNVSPSDSYANFAPQSEKFGPTAEVFPGFEQHALRDGMMWPNDLPGLGIDCDEEAAARYPWSGGEKGGVDRGTLWAPVRKRDGSIVYP